MEELIKQAFLHVEGIGPLVAEGHYDLIGPNGEIILPQVWETMIEPDWSISMHMWPVPEPRMPPIGAGGIERPRSRHDHGGRHRISLPPMTHRGGAGPPPPPPVGYTGPRLSMPGGAGRPGMGGIHPGPGPGGPGGPGGTPLILSVPSGKSSRKKSEAKGGVLSWMAGSKPSKSSSSSGKGTEIFKYSRASHTNTNRSQVQKKLNNHQPA